MEGRKWSLLGVSMLILASLAGATEEADQFGPFGPLVLYHETPRPTNVVLFVSGDGGWRGQVLAMAKDTVALDSLVVGIDIRRYLKHLAASTEPCPYPAADFEDLSHHIQQKLGYPHYSPPILIGYSSGATLVYATIVQAPPNTFRGAISMGFCPDLPLTKPLCKGSGLQSTVIPKGYSFLPAPSLETPWIAFQGFDDKVCNHLNTEQFVKQTKNAEIVVVPKVGHGFGVPANWLDKFKEVFAKFLEKTKPAPVTARPPDVGDLPLIEVPAVGKADNTLTVIVSGDGGWASIDREIGNTLASGGISVVGLNSLDYFWKKREPDETGKDLERILRHYLTAWKKDRILLVGYSMGADVLPFMISRLSPDLKKQIQAVALLGLEDTAEFEFHFTQWLGSESKDAMPVRPEIEKLAGMKILCFCGDEEKDSLCRKLDPKLATPVIMPGSHHMGGDYREIAERIRKEAGL